MKGWHILLWARVEFTTFKLLVVPSLGLHSTGSCFLRTCWFGYRRGVGFRLPLLTLLQLQSYLVPCISVPIFFILKLQNIFCKLFLWSLPLNVLLIVILLDTLSLRCGAFGNTFPVLFQLKRFFVTFEKILQNTIYHMPGTLQNWDLICWRLLSSGFRSVLVNTTDKPLRLKIQFVSRDSVPIDRATCTIASSVKFRFLSYDSEVEVWDLGVYQLRKPM